MNWKEQFEQAVKRQLWSSAEAVLRSFFRIEVANKPERLKDLFAMRAQINAKKHRFLISDLFAEDEKTAFKVFGKLGGDLLTILPRKNYPIPKPLKNLAWEPDNNDLAKLLSSFVSNDQLRIALLGVRYADDYIAATDAYGLFYYPKNPTNNVGIYCLTKRCFEVADGDKIDARFPDVQQVIPKIEDSSNGHIFNAAEWYRLIRLLEDNGFDSYNGKFPIGSFTQGQGDNVLVNLSMLKNSFKSFLQLGHEEVLVFFNGPTKAVVISPKEGFDKAAFNEYKQVFTLLMPSLNTGGKSDYQINFDLNKGTFGLDVSKKHTKIPGMATAKTDTLKAAIEALETATEFAEEFAKKELSTAIEALEVALEFA